MTECPLEHDQAYFPSLGEESVREYPSRHAQLSVRGELVLDHLLMLLPTHLNSQPTSPFPPALLFSICDTLRHGRADGPTSDQNDTSVLPSVLSKLRDWRLLDPDYRYSPRGIHKLALDLAGVTDETCAPTSPEFNRTSHARLRMKWVSSDSPSESEDREPSSPSPPSPPRSGVLVSAQECAYALTGLNERRSDVGYESCQPGRLGTPGSEDDASAIVSRRHHSTSGFRSGCSACRHPRISGPSAPPSPLQMSFLEQRTPFSDVNRFDAHINATVASPRHPEPSVQRTTTKKTKRGKYPSLPSVAHADENEPTLALPIGVQQSIGISFPRQRTHYPRISNALFSREPTSPAAASVQRRAEPSHLLNRAREGDKHTSSHRVASVDLRLPMTHRPPNHASPIDLHPTPRTQSFSHTPVRSHSTGLGSVVVARVQKLSSNAVGSRSSKRLPSWSQSHLHQTTTTSGSLSSPPAKASVDVENPCPYTRLRPSSTLIVPSDMNHRDRRSRTHKHTQSAGSLSSPPLLYARQWQV